MPEESEIKLRVAGPDVARASLERLGATLERPRHFEDNVLFDDRGRSLAARGHVLRIRRVDGRGTLTFKGARRIVEGIKSREELELDVVDPEALRAIVEALGFAPVFRYQKYRETYAWRETEIVVDETPVGTFLEIEGSLEAVHRAASDLGFGPKDYVTDSYAGLFAAAGGTGDMVFR
jgi:adenylate cyclase class 2